MKAGSATSRDQAWLKSGVWLAGCSSGPKCPELDLHRDRHALAGDHGLAGGERRQGGDQPVEAVRQGGTDEALIALVAGAQGHQRAALRQAAGRELGWPLTDQTQGDAIFAPLLGDPVDRAAGRLEHGRAVGRDVAMGLLADEEQRRAVGPLRPERELEDQPAEERDDDVHHLRRDAGEIEDGHRLARHRQAQ